MFGFYFHRNSGSDGCGCAHTRGEEREDCGCGEHPEESDQACCHSHAGEEEQNRRGECCKNKRAHGEECGCEHRHDRGQHDECDCEHESCDCDDDCGCGDDCDCGHDECGCGDDCEHEDCDCCEHEDCDCGDDCDCGHDECGCGSHRRLILETRTAVTLGGIAGALVDLGVESYPALMRLCVEAGLDFPKFGADVVKGCRGIRVIPTEGIVRDGKWIEEKIALVKESNPDAGALLDQIYRVIAATQSAEQGTKDPDFGSFAREDIFTLYAVIAAMLVKTDSDGLTVTPVELGLGEFEGISYPASLAVRCVEGLEITSTRGMRGIDVPAAALVTSVTTEQASTVAGLLAVCGFGFDGDTVARIYLTE